MKPMTQRALTNRTLDFFLLGGASVIVWLTLLVLAPFKHIQIVNTHFTNIAFAASSLAIIVNFPHFMASYKIAYSQGKNFTRKYWFQLLVVPALLVLSLYVAFLHFKSGNAESGQSMISALTNLMFLTVGWHYTKQTFGCMMVYASYDNYKIKSWQKELLKWTLLFIWFTSYLFNHNIRSNLHWNYHFFTVTLPGWTYVAASVLLGVGLLLILLGIFVKKYLEEKVWPSPNMLIPLIAMFVWWVPVARQYDFYTYLTPFFHSLQYLAFVYKYETATSSKKDHSQLVLTVFLLIATGWLSFELLPSGIDEAFNFKSALGVAFCFTTFTLFLNIHHYFIDNVIWRFNNSEVRSRILAP